MEAGYGGAKDSVTDTASEDGDVGLECGGSVPGARACS